MSGYMYCCDENGVLITGDDNQTPIDINGTWYIISPAGKVHTGWQTVKRSKSILLIMKPLNLFTAG